MIKLKELARKIGLFSTVILQDKNGKNISKAVIYDLENTQFYKAKKESFCDVKKTPLKNVFVIKV